MMINRKSLPLVERALQQQPAVALLGPRQSGKTTLAREIARHRKNALVLDLEKNSDRAQLTNPELFFARHRNELIILDEVQTMPDLFRHLRPEIDAHRVPGRFLLLGSASGQLLQQSSESLAGRIRYLELAPFSIYEMLRPDEKAPETTAKLWLRGGFPPSFLADDDTASFAWREDFIQTFLARDLPSLGITTPQETIRRLWQMCAHLHGQMLNASQMALAHGGISHTSIRRYIDWLVDAFMLRRLPPYLTNAGKRLVKSPKIYIRDSGLLHALLGIKNLDGLSGHPIAGFSWEGFVIEQLLGQRSPSAVAGFYRTSAGAELDLVIEESGKKTAYEIKLSTSPKPTKGFWNACEDLGVHQAFVVAPVQAAYPIAANVDVVPPFEIFK
ncbi:ATP-binding protein [beta proteobacterium MWH-UniP1]